MLKLFNTLTRKKEIFHSLQRRKVGFYACGPTVYQYAHLGNLRTYIFEDILKRVLMLAGFPVRHVMNITDVGHLTSDEDTGEDKVEKEAAKQRKSAWDLARFYEKAFKEDIKKLNILSPDIFPRATEHIPEQINLIKKLEDKGYTYRTKDGIYFDTRKFKHYGALARKNVKGIKAGARVAKGEKRHPTDFALWKFSPANEQRAMEWDSPWGKGFPGWHIECSAMAMKYLGESFDVHCGGVDHVPVHHTNEIAQSEAATGKQFAKYWLHCDFLQVKGEKMAKSLGNFIRVKDLVAKGFPPESIRFFYISAHYRTQQNFTEAALVQALESVKRLYEFADSLESAKPGQNHNTPLSAGTKKLLEDFEKFMDDDFNTPMALAALFDFVREANKHLNAGSFDAANATEVRAALNRIDSVLGVLEMRKQESVPGEVMELVREREKARKDSDWKRSDELRNEIRVLGYQVQDTSEGPRVKKL
ncbi:MAG TPA: cysteine--tRNA ligase [archaeon]|nr:cysteine--tRNA ligase [archaeon]